MCVEQGKARLMKLLGRLIWDLLSMERTPIKTSVFMNVWNSSNFPREKRVSMERNKMEA